MSIAENWAKIKQEVQAAQKKSKYLKQDVCVIGVSKLQSEEIILEGIRAGVRHLGENYVQELIKKIENFSSEKDIEWHFIGPLQSNKAKQIVGAVSMIHTLDRESLALVISRLAKEKSIKQKVLVQVNIANEETKNGVSVKELPSLLRQIANYEGLEVVGLMSMTPLISNPEDSRPHFKNLRELRDQMNAEKNLQNKMSFLSMGTSQDFAVAIEEGATHIRIGSTLFGERRL